MTRMKSLISKKLVSIFIAIMLSFLILCNSFIAPERAKVGTISVSFVVGSRWLYSWKNEYQGNVTLEELCKYFSTYERRSIRDHAYECWNFHMLVGVLTYKKKKKERNITSLKCFRKTSFHLNNFIRINKALLDSIRSNKIRDSLYIYLEKRFIGFEKFMEISIYRILYEKYTLESIYFYLRII